MEAVDSRKMTYEEYLAFEEASDEKHEYVNGEVFAMAGGTIRHAAVCTNVVVALANALKGSPCRAYQSDLRVRAGTTGLTTYPDITVVCGPVIAAKSDRHAATNPKVIVEVVGGSTEAYDRGVKFDHYQTVASLTDYVLVTAERRRIDHYRRHTDGTWILSSAGPVEPAAIRIESIGATLTLEDVYAQLDDVA